jgi:GT2 family glycosyltransferase
MSRTIDISIINVTWNSQEFIKGCLDSIFSQEKIEFEVFVVDNDSSDKTCEIIRKGHPQVNLICNPKNLGYAKANNQALELAQGELILFLNPDTKLHSHTLRKMLDFMRGNPETAALGPQLLNLDGTIQPSCREFPKYSTLLWEFTGLSRLFPKSKSLGAWKMGYFNHQEIREVDQPMASALLVRKKVLDELGFLDEGFPIFFNDVDLCYRIKKTGRKIIFYPDAKIVHYKGKSIEMVKPRMIILSHLAFYGFFKKYKKGILKQILNVIFAILLYLSALLRILFYHFKKTIFLVSTFCSVSNL